MTTIDIDRAERGRRAFADVMTAPPPEDGSPATVNGLIDFVFGEVWTRPGLGGEIDGSSRFPASPKPLREYVGSATAADTPYGLNAFVHTNDHSRAPIGRRVRFGS
jgi:hypothetical protein